MVIEFHTHLRAIEKEVLLHNPIEAKHRYLQLHVNAPTSSSFSKQPNMRLESLDISAKYYIDRSSLLLINDLLVLRSTSLVIWIRNAPQNSTRELDYTSKGCRMWMATSPVGLIDSPPASFSLVAFFLSTLPF